MSFCIISCVFLLCFISIVHAAFVPIKLMIMTMMMIISMALGLRQPETIYNMQWQCDTNAYGIIEYVV